jgi:hypothetical protein
MRLSPLLAESPGLFAEFAVWFAVIACLLAFGPVVRFLVGRSSRRPAAESKAEKRPA